MKKTIIKTLPIVMVFFAVALFSVRSVRAADPVSQDETWTYKSDEEGRVFLTGCNIADTEKTITVPDKINGNLSVYGLKNTFKGRTKLESVILKDGIQCIGESSFEGCSALQYVDIPDSVTEIGDKAFYAADLSMQGEAIYGLPSNLKRIGDSAFSFTSLPSITIPDSVTELGKAVFADSYDLVTVNIGNDSKITTCGNEAFSGCEGLQEITIPSGMQEIPDKMFLSCLTLQTVNFLNGAKITSIGYEAFDDCVNLETFTIPSGVKTIGGSAFEGCEKLKSASFPAGLESIGEKAYYCCHALEHADMASCTSGGVRIGGEKLSDGYVFGSCEKLSTATVTKYATQIADSSFGGCESLSTVETAAQKIGESAFKGCKILSFLTLKEGIAKLGDNSLGSCNALASVSIPASLSDIGINPFADCDNLQTITVAQGNTVFDSRDNCNAIIETQTNRLVSGCSKTVIPDSVKSLGLACFKSFDHITEIKFASDKSQLEKIEDEAFSGCTALESITIPSGVKSIEGNPFNSCESLQSIALPDGMTLLESRFTGCSSLSSVRFPWGLTKIYGLSNTNSVESIIIPSSATQLERNFIYGFVPENVYYQGTKEMWDEITIGSDNAVLNGRKITFTEGDIDISKAALTLDHDRFDYTGKEVLPQVSLSYAGLPLVSGREYTVSYQDNVKEGTGKVIVTGKGSFTGSVTKTFKIGEGSDDPRDPDNPDPHKDDKDQGGKDQGGKDQGGKDPSDPGKGGNVTPAPVKKGETVKLSDKDAKIGTFKVVSDDPKDPQVEFTKAASKNVKSITIPDSITDAQGVTYKVTKISKKAFSACKKAKTVTVRAKNLKSIGKGAFKGIKKNAKILIYAKSKKEFNKIKNMIKKSKPGKVKYVFKKG